MKKRRWIPNKERLKEIERAASEGVRESAIARMLGLHPATFSEYKHILDDPAFIRKNTYGEVYNVLDDAIRKGRGHAEAEATSKLWDLIQDPKHRGHTTALIFFLKCQGWQDRIQPGNLDKDDGTKSQEKAKKEWSKKSAEEIRKTLSVVNGDKD